MKRPLPILLFVLFISSCKVEEKNLAGVYTSSDDKRAHLVLKEDKTFEYHTSGTWEYKANRLTLKTVAVAPPTTDAVDDSITRFTSISSFNFWNRFGDPVPIRSILVPPARPKPYFGNALYFFSQDFKISDTLVFYFEGYPPFRFPGSVPHTIGNNIHKITLQGPYQTDMPELIFIVKKDRLLLKPKRVRFEKRH